MKIHELRRGTFLVQHNKFRDNYFLFDGCDGMYGKFIEVNINGTEPGEPVNDQGGYVYFICGEPIESFNLEILKNPKKDMNESIVSNLKKIKDILSSWFK